jgi:hypothetical protein
MRPRRIGNILISVKTVRRVVAHFGKPGECWPWTGSRDAAGYGHVTVRTVEGSTSVMAHRIAYEFLVGPIPFGKQLDHTCRSTGCINPAHLEPVSPFDNVHRSDGLAALNSEKTHCKRGHPLTAGNLRTDKRPWRLCRQCARERDRERKREQRRERGLRHAPRFIPPLKPLEV